MKPLRLAIVGCGHISQGYGKNIGNYPELLEIVGAVDLETERAEKFCEQFGGKAYQNFDDILKDDDVDVVVNLTVHRAHFELNSRALEAGKHVFSEKPMALTYAEAVTLCELARRKNRRLATAPVTYMGEGLQTTARFLEMGHIGKMRLGYAEVNWGQIEHWISVPAPYFSVGPLLDVGVYAITALTFLLGPVRRVWGYSTILKDVRCGQDGQEFPVTAPDFTTGMMEFQNGMSVRITTNYYVPSHHQHHLRGLEFHGDMGSFSVSDFHFFSAQCRFFPFEREAVEVPLLREPQARMDRAVGLADLSLSLGENRPHRASAEHGAHVIEVMEGLQVSSDESRYVEIASSFERPALMDWAKPLKLQLPEEFSPVETEQMT